MNPLCNVSVLANNTRQTEPYRLDFYTEIGNESQILLYVLAFFVLWFFMVFGLGVYISIKYFRMKTVVEFADLDLKKRRIVIVGHVYLWSVVLGIFVLIFRDSSKFHALFAENSPAVSLGLQGLLLHYPIYVKVHFIFLLNLHYVYVRHKRYSYWKVNYVLENYRHYLVLAFVTAFVWASSIIVSSEYVVYFTVMILYIVIMLTLYGINIGEYEGDEINYDPEQPETKLKAFTQSIHFVSLIISTSAIRFYTVKSMQTRLILMLLIFIEPTLLTLSQIKIYLAKRQNTSASFVSIPQ